MKNDQTAPCCEDYQEFGPGHHAEWCAKKIRAHIKLTPKEAISRGLTGLEFLACYPDVSYREACDLSYAYSEAALDAMVEASKHRCPDDMPPCPQCQDLQDEEDFGEYGVS